jgi:hypothetical protein
MAYMGGVFTARRGIEKVLFCNHWAKCIVLHLVGYCHADARVGISG